MSPRTKQFGVWCLIVMLLAMVIIPRILPAVLMVASPARAKRSFTEDLVYKPGDAARRLEHASRFDAEAVMYGMEALARQGQLSTVDSDPLIEFAARAYVNADRGSDYDWKNVDNLVKLQSDVFEKSLLKTLAVTLRATPVRNSITYVDIKMLQILKNIDASYGIDALGSRDARVIYESIAGVADRRKVVWKTE